MLYCEGSAVQAEVALSPHIVDTALMYLHFLKSPKVQGMVSGEVQHDEGQSVIEAALGTMGPAIDEAFGQYLRGKGSHRFKDCKHMLRTTELAVLDRVATWRKGTQET